MNHRCFGLAIALIAIAISSPWASAEEGAPFVQHHILYRSMATGAAASAEQIATCEAHFADRRKLTLQSHLDYRVWGIEIDENSGRITEHNAEDLGPGYLCSAIPPPDSEGVVQAWSYMKFPTLPEFEIEGPCTPTTTVNTGETFWQCKFRILPDANRGIYGGFISSNSVLQLFYEDTEWITGSVWIGTLIEAVR